MQQFRHWTIARLDVDHDGLAGEARWWIDPASRAVKDGLPMRPSGSRMGQRA